MLGRKNLGSNSMYEKYCLCIICKILYPKELTLKRCTNCNTKLRCQPRNSKYRRQRADKHRVP